MIRSWYGSGKGNAVIGGSWVMDDGASEKSVSPGQ